MFSYRVSDFFVYPILSQVLVGSSRRDEGPRLLCRKKGWFRVVMVCLVLRIFLVSPSRRGGGLCPLHISRRSL